MAEYDWYSVSFEDFEGGIASGWSNGTVTSLAGFGSVLGGFNTESIPSAQRLSKTFGGLDSDRPTRISLDYIRATSTTTDTAKFFVNGGTFGIYGGPTWIANGNPSSFAPVFNLVAPGQQAINFQISSDMGAPGLWAVDDVKIEQRKVPLVRDFADASDPLKVGLVISSTQVTPYLGKLFTLSRIKDYDGNLHGGNPDSVKNNYKFQGSVDANGDSILELIFTNKTSGRFVTATPQYVGEQVRDSVTGKTELQLQIDYADHGSGGGTRVAGIYIDPLVLEGEQNGGFLLNGEKAPVRGGPFDSQRRFLNDLFIDNLSVKGAGDFNADGIHEVVFKVNDGTAFLFANMHADINIRYAAYKSPDETESYLGASGIDQSLISQIMA